MRHRAPTFSDGNKWIVKALNLLGSFAQRHGVNPEGLPGWTESEYGWRPPRTPNADAGTFGAWDFIEVPQDGDASSLWKLAVPKIKDGTDTVDGFLTCTNPNEEFDLVPDSWIVARFDDPNPSEFTLELLTDWPIDDNRLVELDGDGAFVVSYQVLWELTETESNTAVRVAGLYAERHTFRLIQSNVQINDNRRVIVPDIAI